MCCRKVMEVNKSMRCFESWDVVGCICYDGYDLDMEDEYYG